MHNLKVCEYFIHKAMNGLFYQRRPFQTILLDADSLNQLI